MTAAKRTPFGPDFDPALTLTVTRNGKEIYSVHGMPQMGATAVAVALTQYDAHVARIAELEAALTQCAVLAEFGTTGPDTTPACKSDALNADKATSLRGSVSTIARAALAKGRA